MHVCVGTQRHEGTHVFIECLMHLWNTERQRLRVCLAAFASFAECIVRWSVGEGERLRHDFGFGFVFRLRVEIFQRVPKRR